MKLFKCSAGYSSSVYILAKDFEEAAIKAQIELNLKEDTKAFIGNDGSLIEKEYRKITSVELLTDDFKIDIR